MHSMDVAYVDHESQGRPVKKARVHYNGDWSGEVIIQWQEGTENHEVRIPARILRAVADESVGEKMKADIIRFIEQL